MARFHWLTGIEDTFIAHSEQGYRRLDEYELMDHYALWQEDVDLMAYLGVDMARYGIPWYKVEAEPGRFDWAWTDRVLAYMVEKGISPVIDLMHYGTPLWLDNLFLNNRYPERVAAYAQAFAERYRGMVTWYTPLNEPYINALFCGETAYWPPYLRGDHGFVTLWKAIARGMVLSEQAIRAVQPHAKFLQVDASTLMLTCEPSLEERARFVNERLFLTYDLLLGRVDGRHPLTNYLQAHAMTDAELDWHQANRGTFDYMGVNFYPHLSVHELYLESGARPEGPSSISFGKHPAGVRQRGVRGTPDHYKRVMRSYWERYGIPIIHTESSDSGPAEVQIAWLEDSLRAVRELRAEGVAVEGYTWWPLYDLVDWEYRYGDRPVEDYVVPMGLWRLEMGFDRVFRRVKTKAADHFKERVATFDPGPIG